MPALKEEDFVASIPSQWFDGTEFLETSAAQSVDAPFGATDDVLAGDFDWVFGDYGLGETVPAESTIFPAWHSDQRTPVNDATAPTPFHDPSAPDLSWLPDPSMMGGDYGFTAPGFTIDPMAVMAPNGVEGEPSRPSSAPGLNGGELSGQMLSVPMADMMTRRWVGPTLMA